MISYMKRVKIEIGGMTCGNCGKHVAERLKKLGAKKIHVDYVGGYAVFSVNAVDKNTLSKAIEEAGYKPGKIFVKEEKGFFGGLFK